MSKYGKAIEEFILEIGSAIFLSLLNTGPWSVKVQPAAGLVVGGSDFVRKAALF